MLARGGVHFWGMKVLITTTGTDTVFVPGKIRVVIHDDGPRHSRGDSTTRVDFKAGSTTTMKGPLGQGLSVEDGVFIFSI